MGVVFSFFLWFWCKTWAWYVLERLCDIHPIRFLYQYCHVVTYKMGLDTLDIFIINLHSSLPEMIFAQCVKHVGNPHTAWPRIYISPAIRRTAVSEKSFIALRKMYKWSFSYFMKRDIMTIKCFLLSLAVNLWLPGNIISKVCCTWLHQWCVWP